MTSDVRFRPVSKEKVQCVIKLLYLEFDHSGYHKNLIQYLFLYNNQINARLLIGQSAMVYCAGKPKEKSRVFWDGMGCW